MLRYRPELPKAPKRQRRDWVFLFESSSDRNPLLARTQIEIIRHVLTSVEHEDRFVILTAGTRTHLSANELKPAKPENIGPALKFLEETHLIGTLDLGKALAAAEPLLKGATNPHLVHLGSGLTGMGQPQDTLLKAIPDATRYVGIGVGKHGGERS